MISALAVTNEIDDMPSAAKDLIEQIKNKINLRKNSIGLLLAEGESEPSELLPALQQGLGIEIIGCSVTAQISSLGYHRLSNSLLVLSADDCQFATAITPTLDSNYKEQIAQTFMRAKEKLRGDKEKAVFLLSTGSQYFTPDDSLGILNELSPGTPIFGGGASDYFQFAEEKVFADGQEFKNRIVLLLISGNIKPSFVVRNIPRSSLATSVITKASGPVVETIDNMTVYEYMKMHDVDLENDLTLYYAPLSVEYCDRDDDGEPVCRPFYTIDRTTGAATGHGRIPQGSKVSLRIIQKEDILKTSTEAIESIMNQVDNPPEGYKYSTIFGVTCAVRHMVLGLDHIFEGDLVKKLLPPDITFAGFYAYAEYCPTSVKMDKAQNKAHNLSIGLCLF